MIDWIFLYVFLLVGLIAFKGAAVLGEFERGVVFRLGRLLEIKGPGLVLIVPFVDRLVKIKLSDEGELVGRGVARFGKWEVPVSADDGKMIGSSVKVVDFSDNVIVVT